MKYHVLIYSQCKINLLTRNLDILEKICPIRKSSFRVTLSTMLRQIFNDFILSAMILHRRGHRPVTIATTELSNLLLSPLAKCCPNDVTLTLM